MLAAPISLRIHAGSRPAGGRHLASRRHRQPAGELCVPSTAGAHTAVERRPSSLSSESERSDAPPGMGVNKTQESSAQSDHHLAVRERVMFLQRLESLHELVEAKDKSIAALSHLLATSVS